MRRQWRKQRAGQIKVLGIDLTRVQCAGQGQIVAVACAMLSGVPIDIELLECEGSVRVLQWIRENRLVRTANREIGAEIIVTDDGSTESPRSADALKSVADELGCQHQIVRLSAHDEVCRAHVHRNVHDLVAQLGTKALEHPDPVPWEMPDMTIEQFLEDLQDFEWIIKGVPHDGQQQLDALAARYQLAPPPPQDHKASMWYRMRLLTLDWSENFNLIGWVRMQAPEYDLGRVVTN